MRRQFIALLMATAVVMEGSIVMAAQQDIQVEKQVQTVETQNLYTTKVGEVTEVTKEDDTYSILVGMPQDGIRFVINNKERIIDADTLAFLKPEQIKEGMHVTVIYPKNAPMGLSLPAFSSSQVAIIVSSDKEFVEQSYFNEELVNEENTLALNIQQDTTIMNITGERRVFTEDDVKNQNVVVIYTTSTRSIPAQASPKMVLVLSSDTDEQVVEAEDNASAKSLEKVEYMSIRELAETKGYKIEWDHTTKTVTLSKDEKIIAFSVGKATFTENEKVEELNGAIKLINQNVYVPEEVSKYL